MNGTIIFGVIIIAGGVMLNASGLLGSFDPGVLPFLIVGVLVAAYGAFAGQKQGLHPAPRRLPSENDPFV
jgi:hypothetical protein